MKKLTVLILIILTIVKFTDTYNEYKKEQTLYNINNTMVELCTINNICD